MIDLQLRMFPLSALTLKMRVTGGPDAWSEAMAIHRWEPGEIGSKPRK